MTHNPDVLDLYRRMSVIRQFEERCLELSRERFISGSIHLCLGQEATEDMRKPLRASANDDLLNEAIDRAMAAKPKAHDFLLPVRGAPAAVKRHMSVTGG